MKDKEKKAIERCNELIKENHSCWIGITNQVAIETILNLTEKQKEEIEKKDKMIDLMAEELVKAHEWFYSEFDNYTKEDFIKYFEKKAEEE